MRSRFARVSHPTARWLIGLAALGFLAVPADRLSAQTYHSSILAGSPTEFGSTDGPGPDARFEFTTSIAIAPDGVLYIADAGGDTIRRVTPSGVVSTLAGSVGQPGSADGTGTAARFNFPSDLALAADGTLYVTDAVNHTIRRVTPGGAVTTVAGSPGQHGSTDGTGANARFAYPAAIVVAPNGTLYVADQGNRTIRAVTPAGVVTLLAGSVGQPGSADGTGSAARFATLTGITADANALYVSDSCIIRKVTYGGTVTTLAGTAGQCASTDGTGAAARFAEPLGLEVDAAGTLFVADHTSVRRISSTGVVTTVASVGDQALDIAIGRHGTFYVNQRRTIRMLVVADTDVVQNGSFANGTTGWMQFAAPDPSHIVSNVTGGVFQFHRQTPPTGTTNQAVVFQETGLPLPSFGSVIAEFQLGNSSTVRKRVSVLLHDSNFQDLSVCTFWLPPQTPLGTYYVLTHTTQQWGNATISFYAATPGSHGGSYQLDNVSLKYVPALAPTQTHCIDPMTPQPSGATGPNLIAYGDFSSGLQAPWGTFGTITTSPAFGVLQFLKPTSAPPAGVVLQATGEAMAANQILRATFQLGNSSSVRKRVTVLLHDNDFSDLAACTFWLAPGQPLTNYTFRTYATKAWTNATLSVYPATTGAESWILLDNVTLQRANVATFATSCVNDGVAPDADLAAAPFALPLSTQAVVSVDDGTRDRVAAPDGWKADGFVATETGTPGIGTWVAEAHDNGRRVLDLADVVDLTAATAARVRLRSWLTAASSRATIDVSADDGATWETVHVVAASDTWVPLEIDLSAYLGERVRVRLVFDTVASSRAASADVWRVEGVSLAIE